MEQTNLQVVSKYPMIEMEEAFQIVVRESQLINKAHTKIITVDLNKLKPGQTLAEKIISTVNIPEDIASTMDGYAVKHEDLLEITDND